MQPEVVWCGVVWWVLFRRGYFLSQSSNTTQHHTTPNPQLFFSKRIGFFALNKRVQLTFE
jgi:hypothetical protein